MCDWAVGRGFGGIGETRWCGNAPTMKLAGIELCNLHAERLITAVRESGEICARRGCTRPPAEEFGKEVWFCALHIERHKEAARQYVLSENVRRQDEWEEAQKQRAAERLRRSVVYFIERDGFVKIGVTTNLRSRMKALASGGAKMPQGMTVGPMALLATMPGSYDNENYLHRRFAHLRIDGEWFLLDIEIKDFIAGLACNRQMGVAS